MCYWRGRYFVIRWPMFRGVSNVIRDLNVSTYWGVSNIICEFNVWLKVTRFITLFLFIHIYRVLVIGGPEDLYLRPLSFSTLHRLTTTKWISPRYEAKTVLVHVSCAPNLASLDWYLCNTITVACIIVRWFDLAVYKVTWSRYLVSNSFVCNSQLQVLLLLWANLFLMNLPLI